MRTLTRKLLSLLLGGNGSGWRRMERVDRGDNPRDCLHA